jgi:hypothetical protein
LCYASLLLACPTTTETNDWEYNSAATDTTTNAQPYEYPQVNTDTLRSGDTLFTIITACAPICSSIVKIHTGKGQFQGYLQPPFTNAVFPEAYIENNKILWRDNTPKD